MENQTRFNLSVAIQNWREELAAQSNLTEEMRRELETHVNDTVAELQRRGLNDEESFWLARRRVGQPKELGEEFGKADPARAGREWVLWFAVALFALELWQTLFLGIMLRLFSRPGLNNWIAQIIYSLNYLPLVWIAISVARGRFFTKFVAWRGLIRSRRRFLVVAGLSYVAVRVFELVLPLVRGAHVVGQGLGSYFWTSLLSPAELAGPVALIAIIVWLLPAEESRTLKRT